MLQNSTFIVIEVNKLKEGSILAEDIGVYDSLKAGTILTTSLIKTIQSINGIDLVKIRSFENDFEQEEAAKKVNGDKKHYKQKISDMEEKNLDHADSISNKIDKMLARRKVTIENVKEVGEDKNINFDSFDNNEKGEAVKILNSIETAMTQIEEIESKPKISKEPLLNKMIKKVKDVDDTFLGLINARQSAVKNLENIVSSFIDETGPNMDSSILLKDILMQPEKYLANHSMNVSIICVSTAIELTKIMTNKLNDPSIQKDFHLLKIIKNKTFNRQEIIKLGFAAFVHDIYFKKIYPDMSSDYKLTSLTDQSNVEKHASESYHLMKQFEMDYHVNKAVLQHHESIDGSGFPDGVTERMFSKYTAILSFAERYITLTHPNPFNSTLHPTTAMKKLLTVERNKFDTDILLAFTRSATMVPIGSWVLMENGYIGYSTNRIEGSNLPIIRAVMKSTGEKLDTFENKNPTEPSNRIDKLLQHKDLFLLNKDYQKYVCY